MRNLGIFSFVCLISILLCGCPPESGPNNPPINRTTSSNLCSVYAPVKVRIVGLTSFLPEIYGLDHTELEVYVDMLDAFDSRIKAAGEFQFELYEYVKRTSDNKGRQIFNWPKIDISDPAENNKHWRDYLRAYQFNLTMDSRLKGPATYILQVTCTTSGDKRLEYEHIIEYQK